MLAAIKNATIYANKYKSHPKAVIVSCYYNPENNPYRLKAFNLFYDSIKHLNHRIIECVIGDGKYQLPENKYISRTKATDLLWHKETLLNKVFKDLPEKYRYVFWIDADVIFDNKNWLVESVKKMEAGANIVQPFSHCVHLDKDDFCFLNKEESPLSTNSFSFKFSSKYSIGQNSRPLKSWVSFASNCVMDKNAAKSLDYDIHGHVGFAWGAKREVLDKCPLYEKCLIGGFDHLQAHSINGHFDHPCILKSFGKDETMEEWSKSFYWVTKGKINYAPGGLYHIWHGDIQKREYLKRIQNFTPATKNVKKDTGGFYKASGQQEREYVKNYYTRREDTTHVDNGDFATSMLVGYSTDSALLGGLVGRNFAGGLVGQALADSQHAPASYHSYSPHSHSLPTTPPDLVPNNAPGATPFIDSGNFS